MSETQRLIGVYNEGRSNNNLWSGYNIKKANAKSVQYINDRLGFQLPASLVEFVTKSKSEGWFAGLGSDYASPFNIIKINQHCRSIRRRVIKGKGRWEYVFPQHFVAITLGHDDDYDCLDLSKYNPKTGEYAIQYWSPPRILGEHVFPDFNAYMASTLKSWGLM